MIMQKRDVPVFQVMPGKKVLFKTFYNGNLKVFNVPYFPSEDNDGTGFIPYEVLFQLSHIFKYMHIHNAGEFDYQHFDMVKTHMTTDLDKKKARKKFNDEKDKFVKYVLDEWIANYFVMKLTAEKKPMAAGGPDNLHWNCMQAQQWLDLFHSKLNELPELHREIVERKYLQIQVSGSYSLDDFVYSEMHIGRTNYYERKKEALYWLGLALWNNEQAPPFKDILKSHLVYEAIHDVRELKRGK